MKKKSSKTLLLHRETLRNLTDPSLRAALGAATGVPCTGTCTVTCTDDYPTKTEGTDCCY